ncbi:GA-binding protein subunit beta-2-like [Argiope bruennichi]|uniref:GA-binding protein subunit beta-2-like n=1 Tax=Argiope bruennichi TaxID=94029 RepID=UPI00249490D6|nr:GA-binding protein subunit beta-2-like [Argiope bruennichi]
MPIENAIPVENEKPLLIHDVSNVEDLKKLLRSGANINEKNKFEETPLLSALRREVGIQIIKEFVLQGADMNANDCWGVTPLYCAIARHAKDLDIVRLLLENGADIKSGKRISDRFLDYTVTRNPQCSHEANYDPMRQPFAIVPLGYVMFLR